MNRTPMTKSNEQTVISGFEFLPALTYNNSIEIFPPFSQLANKHFFNRGLNITILESGSIKINFDNMNLEKRNIFLKDIKSFLKSSRREIIDNFLIYKNKGRI
jgi:hypothetical protein